MHFEAFDLVYIIPSLIIGLLLGFLVARKYMVKYIKENPPINEDMIRTMMTQMGRKPSEKQVRQVMNSMMSQYK